LTRAGRSSRGIALAATIGLALLGCSAAGVPSAIKPVSENPSMTLHARGTFEVKLTPQPADDPAAAAAPGRMTLDKRFHGDLEADSLGQMLAYRTAVEGSAGYVAMERVTGRLGDRQGSFVLQHSGTMARGTPSLSITVVPDSGTDELAGLSGRMNIVIEGGQHSYEFDYQLPSAPR
jgi:hypothetical protein